ncbi:MAG: hypothetical protein ACLP59_32500 [Bryobacteraceae bacterium]
MKSLRPLPSRDRQGAVSPNRLSTRGADTHPFALLVILAALSVSLPGPIAAQNKGPVPRTADGHPDLQGVWTNATITPLERPAALAGKATVTDAEARLIETKSADELAEADGKSEGPLLTATGSAGTGGYNALFIDRGSELARVDGVKRTSLIIDPPDGKVPHLSAEAGRRMVALYAGTSFNGVKDRPLSERCLIGFGSTSGPPMLPVLYNNNYQIVQTPENVMILVEMVHDVRIIRMNATHAPPSVRQWLGDSVGHWEGDTLVVDTTNFTDKTRFRGSTENLHVVERFTRLDAGTILYRATIEDPAAFSRPWTVEYPFLTTPGPIYEYACHEGNYALTDILGGARKKEAEAGR